MKRKTWTVIAALIFGCSNLTGLQDIRADQSGRIAGLIAGLGTRTWDKAVDELVQIGEPAVESLIAELRREAHLTSARAVLALGRIGTPKAVDAVFKALEKGSAPVRSEAANALRYIKSDRATDRLIELLGKDPESRVRVSAAGTLGEMAVGRATDALAAALADRNEYVRGEAAAALGRIGSEKSAEPLALALRDGSALVRERAQGALVRIGHPAVSAVGRLLRDASPQLRRTAALILGRIGSEEPVAELIQALSDEDWMVRNETAVALARLRSGKAALPLKALLEGRDADVRAAAAWILEEIRAPRSGPYLRAVEDTRGDVVRIAHVPYPQTLEIRPEIPSPCRTEGRVEVVVARTAAGRWAVIPVTLENSEKKGRQLMVDAVDFPALAGSGLHADGELAAAQAITGRSLAEITILGRPGALSIDGFLADDEDIMSVLRGDNRLVAAMKLTHRELARPLFHVWNMMGTDLDLGRWSMAEHRWKNIQSVLYHGKTVRLDAGDTKGSQQSIFDDGFDDGSFWIEIGRDLDAGEKAFLAEKYRHLAPEEREVLIKSLSSMRIGEMEPHYIMWYGFYEGHAGWRADPLAIAFIFGLRSLEELEKTFPGRLYEVLTKHFVRSSQLP